MKHRLIKLFSLALALVLLAPSFSAARADDESPYGTATALSIEVVPPDDTGLVRFDDSKATVNILNSNGSKTSVSTVSEALNKVCQAELSQTLDYIAYVSVPATQGTLYDGYNSEGDTGEGVSARKYYASAGSSNYLISNIQFVPKASFTGTAAIFYYGYTAGSSPTTYSGHIYIKVNKQQPSITYATDGEPVQFAESDFVTYSLAVSGRTFRYLTFTLPSSSQGKLYYNYLDDAIYDSAVNAGDRFYRSSNPLLSKVFFVPSKENTSATTVEIPFSGVDIGGGDISGTVYIKVTTYGPEYAKTTGNFTYEVSPGASVTISRLYEFVNLCKSELGADYTFDRIRFMDLPNESEGVLYHGTGTTKVYSNRDYNASTYSPITDIRFVANYNFAGTVSVPFRGYGSKNGNTRFFEGTLLFVVKAGVNSPLHYTVAPGKRVFFENSDFAEVAHSAMGSYGLTRIQFNSLPAPSNGTLEYISGNSVSTVTANKNYTGGSLSNLSFIASSNFVGEITIPFTGYSYSEYYSSIPSWGRTFSGVVTITSTVADSDRWENNAIGSNLSPLTYYTSGTAVTLRLSELQNYAAYALTDIPETISLTRPNESEGKLCFDFVSPAIAPDFDPSKSYPFSDAGRISFLPKAGFSGTAQISYTVSNASGTFRGNIQFVVSPSIRSSFFSDMNEAVWAIPSVDFFRYYGTVQGVTANTFAPSQDMRRGDFILLLSRAFSYPYAGTQSFADVAEGKWYAAAIASAKTLGVVTNADAVTVPNPEYAAALEANPKAKPKVPATISGFDPAGAIKREDAALFLYRTLRCYGLIEPGSAQDLASFSDRGDVSSYAVEAMGALVREGIFEGYGSTLQPRKTLTRAETTAILHRALT